MESVDTPVSSRRGDVLYPVALAVVGFAFALVPLVRGEFFFYWDNARLHFPRTVELHDALRAGRFPEWSASVSSGYPVAAEGNAALFHPIHLLVTWLFPPHAAFMLEIGLYMALLGVATYLFLRGFGTARPPSLFAGLTGMLGGFFVVSIKNIAHMRSLWLLPLVLLCAERYATGQRRTLWICLAGLGLGLQLLSGNPHYAVITAVASGFWVLFRVWHRAWNGGDSLRQAVSRLASAGALWILAGGIATAVAAVQIIPQMLHVEQSTRSGGMSFDFAVALPASLRYLGQLLLPFAYEQGAVLDDPAAWGRGRDFNDVSYRGFYMGTLPFVLAVIALVHPRRWPWPGWVIAALAFTGIALALGELTPLYPALWSLPFIGRPRFTYRYLAIAAFCIATLAGLGLAHLMDARTRAGPDPAASPADRVRTIGALAAVLLLAMGTAVYLRFAAPDWLLRASDFERGVVISLAMVTGACLLVFATSRATGTVRGFLCVALITLTAADLLWFRARSGYAPTVAIDHVMTPPPPAALLDRDDDAFRVLSLERWEDVSPRNENIFEFVHTHASLLWGLDSADPYESLMLRRYFMVREAALWELLHSPGTAARLQGFLGALNVKYVVAPAGVKLEGWQRVHESPRAATWRNPSVLPRAFLVGDVERERIEERQEWVERARTRQGRYADMVRHWATRVADSQILDNILAKPVDYASTAIVAASPLPEVGPADPNAVVVEHPTDPDAFRYSVTTESPAFLVISSNFYPGWTATVNGRPAPIYRTNWVLSGVPVPAGSSEIVLRFRTPGLTIGLAVTLITTLLVAALLLRLRRNR